MSKNKRDTVLWDTLYFMYLSLPFGLKDAMRVLTKLMKSPLERWRNKGMMVFIHVDDGLGIVRGRQEALKASRRVREELGRYGCWYLRRSRQGGPGSPWYGLVSCGTQESLNYM